MCLLSERNIVRPEPQGRGHYLSQAQSEVPVPGFLFLSPFLLE